MLKLFYIPKTRASRVRWMLEELGEPYELARIDWPHARGAEYRRNVHPLGAVPALQDEGLVVIESAAIIAYLADKFPERGFAPPPQERGPYYQWIVYAMATLEPLVSQLSRDPGSEELQEKWGYPAITDDTRAKILGLNLAKLAKIEPVKRVKR